MSGLGLFRGAGVRSAAPELWSVLAMSRPVKGRLRRPLRGYALDRPRHGQDEPGIQGGRKTGRPGLWRGGAFYASGHEIL